MQTFEHVIHIGYPKAGSHFVQRWFDLHPQIQYVQRGFAGFKDATDLARQSASEQPIRLRATSAEELSAPKPSVGRITEVRQQTHADFQQRTCDTIAQLFRDPWIIFLTRGFRSALFSGFSQYLREGGDQDFYTGRKPTREDLDQAAHSLNYNFLIEIYRRKFGERLIILPYELLRDDPVAFLRQLESRLGLDRFDAPVDKIHASFSPVELRWYPRISRIVRAVPGSKRVKHKIFAWYVRSMRAGWWALPIRVAQKIYPATPLTIDMVPAETVEYFRGRADCLKEDPLYRNYAEEYLF